MRAYVYYKTAEAGYLWYKPYLLNHEEKFAAPDLLFRPVPGDIAMRMEMELGFDEWTLDFYNCFSGNHMASLHYHRTEKLTWKGLHLALRHHLLDKHLITGAMSFKVFYENSEPTSLQSLVFKPYKYDEVEPRNREAVAKLKAKSAPKAKSFLKLLK